MWKHMLIAETVLKLLLEQWIKVQTCCYFPINLELKYFLVIIV